MKVLILTHNPFPYGMAGTNRIMCYARGLLESNIEVSVVITKRTESADNIINYDTSGIYNGIKFYYAGKSTIRSNNKFLRLLNVIFDSLHAMRMCIKILRVNDILLLYEPQIYFSYFLFFIAKCKNFKIVRELCEYPYVAIRDSIIKRIKLWICLHLVFKLYDGFIVISHSLLTLVYKYKSKKAKCIIVPILVDYRHISNKESIQLDIPYIFFAGVISERKDGIVSVMKAFAMIHNDIKVKYILAGPIIHDKDEIIQIIENNDLSHKIEFLGNLKNEEVIGYQKGATLSILNKNDNLQNIYGFSTKLGEILACGTAVITTSVGEANYYLKDGFSAYIVEPHQPHLIAQKIKEAFLYPEIRKQIAENGQQLARDQFDYKKHGKRLADFFMNLEL